MRPLQVVLLQNRVNLKLMSKFYLIFLFNDISTFVGYLMPKPFMLKNSKDTT